METLATYTHVKNVMSLHNREIYNKKHKEWLKNINKKYSSNTFKPPIKTKAEYMEAYVQHKFKRWEKEHPRPWKWEGTEQFLFEQEYLKPWEDLRDKELERIRDFVVSVYNKILLVGRYETDTGKYKEKYLKGFKSVKGYHNINDIPVTNKWLRSMQEIANKEKRKNNKLVCIQLKDTANKVGRLILPIAA